MATLSEKLGNQIDKKDEVKNIAKGSKNHLKKTDNRTGARTKSVCYKVNPELYDQFKLITDARGQKPNALINQWITEYVTESLNEGKWL